MAKIHVLNDNPSFSQPTHHKRRPQLLELAKLRAKHMQIDTLGDWKAMRSVLGPNGRPKRANTRDERERVALALSVALLHRANLVHGRVWASQEVLAKDIGATNSRISRCVDDFVNAGWLRSFHVHDAASPGKYRCILYVEDAFFLALGFDQSEIDRARMVKIDSLAEAEKAKVERIQKAILRRQSDRMKQRQYRRQRKEAQKHDEKINVQRERTRIIAELHEQHPTLPIRELAERADALLAALIHRRRA